MKKVDDSKKKQREFEKKLESLLKSRKTLDEEEKYDGLSAIIDLLTSARFKFNILRDELLCNNFIYKNRQLGIDFPVPSGFGITNNHIDSRKEIKNFIASKKVKFTKLNKSAQEELIRHLYELEKKAAHLLNAELDGFDAIDIRNEKSFYTLNEYFIMMDFILKDASENIKNVPFSLMMGAILDRVFYLMLDLNQKYSNLIAYHSRRFEEKKAKIKSGKGQQDAKENRAKVLVDELIKKYVKKNSDILLIDKDEFTDILNNIFKGAQYTKRQYSTVRTYKERAEDILGKKIVFTNRKKSKKEP